LVSSGRLCGQCGKTRAKKVLIKLSNKWEITMTQSKQHKKSRLGHWMRIVVMFLSGGFIFPHAMTEDQDIAEYDTNKDARVKKQ
jgi:hypothetical protein